MIPVRTVLGSGVAALACALRAARYGPILLCGRHDRRRARTVESVPAATLTLLLEFGITPGELGVHDLSRDRIIAWEHTEPHLHVGRACAHIDSMALYTALYRRVIAHPAITWRHPQPRVAGPGAAVDATGRHAIAARPHLRPPRTWTAAAVTVPSAGTPGELHLAAGHNGYAYRLGCAHWTTIGWVAPGDAPRRGADLHALIQQAGAGWLLAPGPAIPDSAATARRPASAAVPTGSGPQIPIGDAALARDALAAQGVALALSDAHLLSDLATTPATMAARRADAAHRHLRHLGDMLSSCVHAHEPVWAQYRTWIAATCAQPAQSAR